MLELVSIKHSGGLMPIELTRQGAAAPGSVAVIFLGTSLNVAAIDRDFHSVLPFGF
jgi:hypothetical protein